MTVFKLPDLGEGLEEAEIVHWHVSPGDRIAADQPLVSVETDKAVVEVPAPWTGRVASLFAKTGDMVKVGAPLAEIETGAASDTGTVVGTLGEKKPAPPAATEAQSHAQVSIDHAAHIKAAPAVRAFAHERGVDLASVHGTGPEGAITHADVERASASAPQPAEGFEPLRGARRAMARNMARAGREIVPATVTEEADVSHWPEEPEVTLLAIEAILAAARAEPALNAWFDSKREARRLNSAIDIAVAVDTPDGLIVPVLRTGAHEGQGKLRAELHRLVKAATARTLTREQMADATITLSNFGGLGGLFATLVIVPPQVGILGVGRIRTLPGPEGKPLRFLPLSLTFDHRAVTGGEAARFLSAAKKALETAQ
jgi:2-oxoisovalerate dehydrogenase E2 component (dihydrolipoyl transacylase)